MFELLLITDPAAPGGIAASLHAALRTRGVAGRVAVQLRAKALEPSRLAPLARELRELTRQAGVALLLNGSGSLALAREIGADGLHLPEADLEPAAAREALGAGGLLGVSCHDPLGLVRAAQGGADYATLSPVFDSPGKAPALGVERFARWTAAASLPVIALGGIRAERVAELRQAGARGIAVISAVFGAAEPAAALEELLEAWRGTGCQPLTPA